MLDNRINLKVKFELTDEQQEQLEGIADRLNELNLAGHLGLVIAQIDFVNGRCILKAGLIEDEDRAIMICMANGQTHKSIEDTMNKLREKIAYFPLDNGEQVDV